VNRPSQRAWTLAELDELPTRVNIPTAASILGVGNKTLRGLFGENGGHTAHIHVGDLVIPVTSYRVGGQRWVVTESLKRVFQARGP
jgi:hypothetical protein